MELVGLWNAAGSTGSISSSEGSSMLKDVSSYMAGNCQKTSIFAFSESANIAVGMYVGGSVHHPQNVDSVMQEVTKVLQSTDTYQSMALQHCGKNANSTLGIAVDFTGDLAAVQQLVRTWNDGDCVSGFTTSSNVSTTLSSTQFSALSNPAHSNRTLSRRSPQMHGSSAGLHRRSTCSYVQVVSGDSCGSLVTECGITADEFYEYNPASDLCSTLAVGQYVCCSAGDLPDLAPSAYANGTCYTYDVQSGDTCSAIAAKYTLTVDDIDNFNSQTWGWYGCDDLQAGASICLSNGTAPFPLPLANAVCGPQLPGTDFTGTDNAGEWAALNPCPIAACCDIWGQCGNTPDYCNDTLAASGAPGTAPPGSNGCIWNCGTTIINDAVAPASYSSVGYFEATNTDRPCLNMDAFTINPADYTHVLFAFGNITSDYAVSITGAESQFELFTELENVKRIISFGGWDFSTGADTYMIFREGVTAANRDTLVENVANFVTENDLDGVDFDWEYPGEPDIPGIPAGSDEDGSNYLEFLTAMRAALPDKSISITAPASYWYLKAFPIAEIAKVVDFITFMTYDLHGIWDLSEEYSQSGCTAGDCLFSHVNMTETMWALAMISKAPVATNMIMVGVASYGRSFEMTTVGCWTSSCTWDTAGAEGPCTQTAGYISNAEINQILAENSDALSLYSSGDETDILVYNETQWVGYMSSANKANRTSFYRGFNFAGTGEWAIDLETFEPYLDTTSGEFIDLGDDPGAAAYDINEDIPCYSVSTAHNTTAELESVVALGAEWIDIILTEYADNPTDWFELMTSHYKQDSCADFPSTADGACTVLDETICVSANTTALYWASFVGSTLYANWVQWYNAFNDGTFLGSLSISTIATTFTPSQTESILTWDSFINGFTTALSIGTSVLPDPEGVLGDFNTGVSTVESIIGYLSADGSGFTLPTTDDIEDAMNLMLGTLINSTWKALGNLSTAVFEYPNEAAANLSQALTNGSFVHPVANYFYNVKPVSVIDTQNFTLLVDEITKTVEKYLVGVALTTGDYYVVKYTGFTEADCTGTAEYYINDACYMLAYPGESSCQKGLAYQVNANSTTITNIEGYGIDITEMILNSETCQNNTNTYYGATEVNVNDVATSGTLPVCFYNLPVFELLAQSASGENWAPDSSTFSPCWITDYQNNTGDNQIAGRTYLPSNLETAFTSDLCYCQPAGSCYGPIDDTNNGTTDGILEVC
ncbi:Glycoside hydrolase, superfamily [Penicillium occitanis (nom. inval.)]|nr:Glycoside hydrolase, superfamily [Penicillium occitanis (nom. inval.)]